MRYAEGLLCYFQNQALFAYDPSAPVETLPDGRRFADDRLIVLTAGEARPIFPCHTVPKDALERLALRVVY